MKEILKALIHWNPGEVSFERLGDFVRQIDIERLNYQDQVPAATDPYHYSRTIMLTHPVECVLVHWPPGVASAVHLHDGFWGHTLVLEGSCENLEFELHNDTLYQTGVSFGRAGQVLSEKAGIIHQVRNANPQTPAVSLHFYFPAFDSLAGMRLFDLKNQRIGILNEAAQTTSWKAPSSHFDSIVESAFQLA
ncbi:MAG: cysteine dioxygenase family protein [Salibacteraceae bacterium]